MTSFVDDDGNYLEYSGEDFNLTKQIVSIFDGNIKGDVSLNFELSGSSTNRKTLGYVGPMQLNSPAFSNNPFSVVRNGNVINKGYIVIQVDSGKTLNCFFFSGNANWFNKVQFSCKDIRNSDLDTVWNPTVIKGLSGATKGICFPFIDFLWGGARQQKYFMPSGYYHQGDGNDNSIQIVDLFPCLFVHTLVEEFCKIANLKLSGTLLNDGLYKSLIVTPSGPTLIDPESQMTISADPTSSGGASTHTVTIGSVAPDIKAIEVLKWLIFSFGCVPTYDIHSNTLNLDLLFKKKKEDAQDWSQYIQDFNVKYDKVSQNNYIRNTQGPEQIIKDYNSINSIPYGDLNIISDKDDGSENELYSSPFLSVQDVADQGNGGIRWKTPFVQFYKFTDDKAYPFTTVTDDGSGRAVFNGVGFPFSTLSTGVVIRVEGTGGNYNGYHVNNFVNPASATTFNSLTDFGASVSGTIYTQKISVVSSGPRILIFQPVYDTNNFSNKNNFDLANNVMGNVGYAYWSKVSENTPNADDLRVSMSYGDIQNINLSNGSVMWYSGINLGESYLLPVRKMVTSPYFQCKFLLPEAVFQKFNFEYVYLLTKDLSGYFIVDRIYAYRDSRTQVEVDLYSID